ncbi:hypothetical protein DSO57_1021693 [Entomophthora muscae]|uniref:Uncharacterized protein n=1 Tax=Entomophthora muscae TaxID=34485 RepID=A0ACC2SSZ3_9FUNG|nr:hypothetical protein DSO57_1021693 [Entomophthora muscae]
MDSEAFSISDTLNTNEKDQVADKETPSSISEESEFCSDDSGSEWEHSNKPLKRHRASSAVSNTSSCRSGKGSRGGFSNLVCTFAGCGRSFNRNSRLLNHFRTHTQEKPFQCPFDNCPKRYAREDHLNRHLFTHAPRPLSPLDGKPLTGIFECTVPGCGKSFASADYLKKHIKRHTDPVQYKCTWEGCTFTTNKHKKLYLHKCRHENILPYPCPNPDCNKRFLTPNKRDNHAITHTVSRLYLCGHPSCGARFNKWSLLQTHLAKEHALICPVCQKTFSSKKGLKRHFRKHVPANPASSLELPDTRLKCPYEECSSSFRQKKSLTLHIRTIHQCLESHTCPVDGCDHVLLSEDHLQAHLQWIHPQILPPENTSFKAAPEKPPSDTPEQALLNSLTGHSQPTDLKHTFPCPIQLCTARYKQINMLENHLASIHQVEIPALLKDDEPKNVSDVAHLASSYSMRTSDSNKSALDIFLETSIIECSTVKDPESKDTSSSREANVGLQYTCTFPGCHKQYKNISSLYRHRKHGHSS